MSEALKALEEVMDVLCNHLGPKVLHQDIASDIDIDRHDDFRNDMRELAADILALPTLRAALSPAPVGDAEIEAIRARHLLAEADGWVLRADDAGRTHRDRATLLSALTASEARAEAAEARVRELEEALKWFLDDPRFQVAVGGNPNVVERMIADATRTLKGAPDER